MANNKIIIVDDDEDLLKLLVASFKAKGFESIVLKNGTEAMKYLLDEKNVQGVSLLILDRILPDMDGVEILKMVQPRYGNKLPVLILSILSSEKDILNGLAKGAVDYMGKPFSLPILIEKSVALMNK